MKNRFVALAAATLVAACSTAPQQQPSEDPSVTAARTAAAARLHYGPREALYPVGAIPSAVVHDAKRNRDLVVNIEYPTRGGPYPVIIFSHGFGSSKDAYTGLSEYWAGRGYIVIKPSHADAGAIRSMVAARRAKAREEAAQRPAGQPQPDARRRDNRRNAAASLPPEPPAETLWQSQAESDWQNRARDISAVIDSFGRLQESYPELAGKMDVDHVGVAGHSYGAFTTMLVSGATSFKTTPPAHLVDTRVRAAIAMSPQGTDTALGLTSESWKDVRIPTIFMTGSLDRGLGADGDPKWRHEPFAYSPAGDKYFLSFEGGRNSAFAGGTGEITDAEIGRQSQGTPPMTDRMGNPITQGQQPRISRGENPFESQRRIFAGVQMASTAFWDAYLKDNKDAREYLNNAAGIETLNGGHVTVERK